MPSGRSYADHIARYVTHRGVDEAISAIPTDVPIAIPTPPGDGPGAVANRREQHIHLQHAQKAADLKHIFDESKTEKFEVPDRLLPDGTPQGIEEKPVGIIGGGAAGLYTAMMLQSLGIKYEILEASDRIGGRLFTKRFNKNPQEGIDAPVGDPKRYDYIDMGAMRYPNIPFMKRNFDLFQQLQVPLTQYFLKADNTVLRFNDRSVIPSDGKSMQEEDVFKVTVKNLGFVPDEYVGTDNDGSKIMAKVLSPWITLFAEADKVFEVVRLAQAALDEAKKQGDPVKIAKAEEALLQAEVVYTEAMKKAWDKLMEVDHLSTRGYMLRPKPWIDTNPSEYPQLPESVVEWLESMGAGTGMYNGAFAETVMMALDFGDPSANTHPAPGNTVEGGPKPGEWVCIDGGSDRLSIAMENSLKKKPEKHKRVNAIYPRRTREGGPMTMKVEVEGESTPREFSHVVSTVPLGCYSSIDISECSLSYTQKTAIRSVAYLASTKIAIRFEKRWWEDPEIMGARTIKGGVSATDMPVRMVVYPSYAIGLKDAPGVLLASYNWAQDAARFGPLAFDTSKNSPLLKIALENLEKVHNIPRVKMGPVIDWYPHAWYNDETTRGAFAIFGPGQFGKTQAHSFSLFASLQAPAAEGRLHFAGEATSIHHGWVLGALNSAWRSVYHIVAGDAQKLEQFLRQWGLPDEYDFYSLERLHVLGALAQI
jgi:monoamine oxidase